MSVADEAVRIANGILNRTGASPFPKPGKTDPKKDAKKGVGNQVNVANCFLLIFKFRP